MIKLDDVLKTEGYDPADAMEKILNDSDAPILSFSFNGYHVSYVHRDIVKKIKENYDVSDSRKPKR